MHCESDAGIPPKGRRFEESAMKAPIPKDLEAEIARVRRQAAVSFLFCAPILGVAVWWLPRQRSEEHTSELQSLMRISYAVFCLKKKKTKHTIPVHHSRNHRTTTNNSH